MLSIDTMAATSSCRRTGAPEGGCSGLKLGRAEGLRTAETLPAVVRSSRTLPGGQNDAYRSQKTVKVGGHLGNVGLFGAVARWHSRVLRHGSADQVFPHCLRDRQLGRGGAASGACRVAQGFGSACLRQRMAHAGKDGAQRLLAPGAESAAGSAPASSSAANANILILDVRKRSP